MMFTIIWTTSLLMFTVDASSLKWSIDWDSQSNLLSGSYLSKDLLRRIVKLDNILQQRIIKLDEEIAVNFHILLGITSLMGIVLVLVISNFYRACKQRVDSAISTENRTNNDQLVPTRNEQIVDLRHQVITRQPVARETSKGPLPPARQAENTYVDMKAEPEYVQCKY